MRMKMAVREALTAFLEDRNQYHQYLTKYHGRKTSAVGVVKDVVEKIGLQMMGAVRLMQAAERAHVPLVPQVASRLIRHLYGAEIHWKAKFEPGVAIVHGCGLVISHAATVGPGCLLFQNVTLGESVDPETRAVGAPTLGRNVHIGPGATLIGPITVGDRSKIMAGAVLTHSVPPDSLVRPAETVTTTRRLKAEAPSETKATPRTPVGV